MTNIIDILNNELKCNKNNTDSYDKNNNNIKKSIEKNKGGRPNKDLKYAKERKMVLDNLLNILNVTKDNNIFYIDDLEKNNIQQQQILDLEEDVKKFFSCSTWTYFVRSDIDKKYISLTKSILKNMEISYSSVTLRDDAARIVLRKGYKVNI